VPDDPRIDTLLDRYQDVIDSGRSVNLDEFCSECPELRGDFEKRVARLRKVGRLLNDPPLPATAHVEIQPEISLSDDKTWVSQGTGYVPPVEIPAPPGYQVLAPLGEGGMGVVYKARQVGLDRLVALKMILAGTRARAVDLDRFRNEAQAIAALRHPNIVQVFEIGEFREQPFFSIEFCAGGTLAKAVNGEPQSPVAAAGIAEVLARAMHYAHSRGIVHRDLKPGNVLLSAEPAPPSHAPSTIQADAASVAVAQAALRPPYAALKITDFGLAKRVDDDSGRTQDGSVMGTPAYMAPEQAFGATKDISSATDIHALGAILYELLTGRPPFKGSTVHDTLELVRHRDPVPVRTLQPQVPGDLETICLKCLQKDPKKRYASALALADDLRRFLDQRPIQARPVGQITQAWRWIKREPRTAALVAAMVILCVAIPSMLVAYSVRLGSAEELVEQHRLGMLAAQRARNAANEAGETSRYHAAVSEAARLRTERQPGWTWQSKAQVETAAGTITPVRELGALRSELAAAVAAIDLRPIGVVAREQYPGAVAFAPDGRIAVVPQFIWPVLEYRHVRLVDPQTKTEQRLPFRIKVTNALANLLGVPDMVTALAFSPDNRWLFLGLRHGGVLRWRVDASREPEPVEWRVHDSTVAGFAFSPDSQWVFTGGKDGHIKRWRVDGDPKDAQTWPEKGAPSPIAGLAFWTGPRTGVLVLGADKVRLLDASTLGELGPGEVNGINWVAPGLPGSTGRLAVYPANNTIAISRGGAVEIAHWERGILKTVATLGDPSQPDLAAHCGPIETMAFHPSGILLATVCPSEGMAKIWHLGRGELAVALPAAGSRSVAFSADGSTFAVGGDHFTTLYEIGGLTEHTFLGYRGFKIQAMGLTHDDRVATIAGRPDDGSAVASVWDQSGKLVETVVHRASGSVVTRQYRVATNRASGWTAYHAGDDAVTWCRTGSPPFILGVGVKSRSHFDLSIAPDGKCWMIDSGDRLTVRAAASSEKPRPILASMPWTGRNELECVRAGGSYVLVGCENGYLRVISDGKLSHSLPCFTETEDSIVRESANIVHAAAVTDDGTLAVAGTEDGRLWLFRLPGEQLVKWAGHRDRVTAVAFDRTGEWLATGGRDRVVRVWRRNAEQFLPYLELRVPDGQPIRQVMFSPTGDRLLVLRENETAVRVWHLDKLRTRFKNLRLDP